MPPSKPSARKPRKSTRASPRKPGRATARKPGRQAAAGRRKPTATGKPKGPVRKAGPSSARKSAAASRREAGPAKRPKRRRGRTHPAPRRDMAMRPRPPAPPHRTPLRIVLFGAGGMIGSRIAREALERGHNVTPIQRNAGALALGKRHLDIQQGDVTDAKTVTRMAKGHDAIVSAVSPRVAAGPGHLAKAARAILQGARASGVRRVVIVGGAGSLEVAPGQRLIDSASFPDAYKPEAQQHVDALDVLRTEGEGISWTFVSPAAMIEPGPRTGRYQAGGDQLLVGKDGKSQISAEDYAVAIVDELEKNAAVGRRITVAWP